MSRMNYQTDEFLFGGGVAESKTHAIEKKVSLLYDFCVLTKRNSEKEDAIRTLLEQCKHEYEMSQVLHCVLCGDTTIDELLAQKGVM